MKKIVGATAVLVVTSLLTGCQGNSASTNTTYSKSAPLLVYYAGSMTKVMEKNIGPGFQSQFGAVFQGRGAGSSELAQMMRAGLGQPDVFVSASPAVNHRDLMGAQNHNLVTWYLTLARDQLVIAYSPSSRFETQLQEAQSGNIPWYDVLKQRGFLLGRTDPKLDPKGLSTIYMFELAAKFYHVTDLATQILGPTENPKQVFPEESLLAQLTSGQLDAVIAYKHEAVEWKMPYISLPDAVNLGNPEMKKAYEAVSFVNAEGKTVHGAPILFTITIPTNSTHQAAAQAFVRYMISGSGHQALMADGFTPISTLLAGNQADLPSGLKSLIQGTYK